MIKLISKIFISLPLFTALICHADFYQPAQYRWYIESIDLSAGIRPSQPICKVLTNGTTFPIKFNPQLLIKKNIDFTQVKGIVVIRQGMTGKIYATTLIQPEKTWTLPYLPFGFYRVMFKGITPQNKLAFTTECTVNILEDTTTPELRTAPIISNDIFAISVTDGLLKVSGLPEKEKNLELHIIGRNYTSRKEFEQLIPVSTNATTAELKLKNIAPGKFLNLSVILESQDSIIDQANIFYFKKGNYPETIPDWSHISKPIAPTGLNVHENQLLLGSYESNLPGLKALVTGMKERGSNMININFKWFHVEPVCGVYDWSELDKYIKFFTDRGICFGIITGGGIFNTSPYDTWGEWMMDSNGNCQVWRNLCITSPASKKYSSAAKKLIKALYKRYGSNPCFISWTFSGQGLDSGIFMDHFNRVTDYSPWAQKELIQYLKKRYPALERLNAAWGSDFKSWSEVTPPLPDWNKKVDISYPWLDFNAAKLEIYKKATTELFDPTLRSVDSKRPASHYATYTGPIEYLFAGMRKNHTHLNDGGGEAHQMVRLYSIAANWKIKRQPESHYVPPAKRCQLQDMITNALRYGFENYDLGMVWNSQVNLHVKRYPANLKLKDAMKFWTTVIPVLRTLTTSTPDAPPVGFILSWDDMFCRTRAWRWYALPGDELQKVAAKVSLGNVPWLSGITPHEIFERQKLIVCDADNQVFSQQLIYKLARFVKKGGTLAICENAGEFTPGCNPDKFLWRTLLHAPELSQSSITSWSYGKGRIIYSPKAFSASKDGSSLTDLLSLCKIPRKVVSSNSAVQGFLLKNNKDTILVISAFRGFDELRKQKGKNKFEAKITLPNWENGSWQLERIYPAATPVTVNNNTLSKNGISVQLEASGLLIYRLKKTLQK